MEDRYGALGRVWIADGGMASAEIWPGCARPAGATSSARRIGVRKFAASLAASDGWRTVQEGVEVNLAPHSETDETVILCRSADRRAKERRRTTSRA